MGTTRNITKQRRQSALQKLQECPGRPVHNLPKLLGVSKAVFTRHIIGGLREQGYDIISLYDGYMLQDTRPTDRVILARIDELETMLKKLIEIGTVSVPEKLLTGNREQGRNGRPRLAIPTEYGPLIKAIKSACIDGNPYTKTGTRGVYARREELPKDFRVGRNRLEGLIDSLLNSGLIIQAEAGSLSVPSIVIKPAQ